MTSGAAGIFHLPRWVLISLAPKITGPKDFFELASEIAFVPAEILIFFLTK